TCPGRHCAPPYVLFPLERVVSHPAVNQPFARRNDFDEAGPGVDELPGGSGGTWRPRGGAAGRMPDRRSPRHGVVVEFPADAYLLVLPLRHGHATRTRSRWAPTLPLFGLSADLHGRLRRRVRRLPLAGGCDPDGGALVPDPSPLRVERDGAPGRAGRR